MDIPLMSDKEYDELAKTLASQGSLALHEHHPDLEQLRIGLTWHDNGFDQHKLELNLSAVMLTGAGCVRSADDFIFYNRPRSSCGSVKYLTSADPKTNQEKILVDLSRVPAEIEKIILIASIHRAADRGQNFGLVRSAQVALHNEGRGGEYITHLDLTEDTALATATVVGELVRGGRRKDHRDWRYIRSGIGDEGGIQNLLLDYGIEGTTS